MFLVLIAWYGLSIANAAHTDAYLDMRKYYILDNGHDLWAITPQKWWWYKAKIPYTNWDLVRRKMLLEYDYQKDFYQSHNFTKDIVNGKYNKSQTYVEWNKPLVLTSVEQIKKITPNVAYSFRKNGKIQWTYWRDTNEFFLSWYNSKNNQNLVIYPIFRKVDKKVVAFLEYPCGNLVCEDDSCSALKETPKVASCEMKLAKNNILDNEPFAYGVSKSASWLKVYKTTLWKYNLGSEKNIPKVNAKKYKLRPWTYELKWYAFNPYTWEKFQCKSTTLNVDVHAYCWDGKVNQSAEECDDGNNRAWDGCYKCKYEIPKCTIETNQPCYNYGDMFKFDMKLDLKGKLKGLYINQDEVNIKKWYKLTTPWTNILKAIVVNPINSSIATSCSTKFMVNDREYCWDGVINQGEECDFNDPYTWIACNTSCKFKNPTTCRIEVGSNLYTGRSLLASVEKDTFSVVRSITINWKNIKRGDFGIYRPNKTWLYTITAVVQNVFDRNSTKVCTAKINVVSPKAKVCRIR